MQKDAGLGGLSPFGHLPVSPFRPEIRLDGIIVLGARLNPKNQPGRVAQMRLVHALHLWHLCDFPVYLLLTGGRRPGTHLSEARAMADWALNWVKEHWCDDVREDLSACLILEEASHNTAASARHTLPLVKARGSRTVGLVSDSLHIPRAKLIFQHQFRPQGIRVHPLPARGLVRHYWQNRRYWWLSKMALREGGAWLKVLGRLVWRPQER
jgi:uncharacterized SAM-binding protein YcdF (DUF218 family)